MSDYHRRFTQHARKYLDDQTFNAIHVKARSSTGGAAPRTPKAIVRQPIDDSGLLETNKHREHVEMDDDKQPVTKSALDAIRGMWDTTVDAILGRQRIEKSGVDGGLGSVYVPAPIGPAIKETRTKPKKKKRVTKSALDGLASAVADMDGVAQDGLVAIQLGADYGRTKGAIGFASKAHDKATIAYDLSYGVLPLPDASVNHVYVTKSAIDAGLDLDGLMPEVQRVCAQGARIYTDATIVRVEKSSGWDESAHPRAENGEFGAGGGSKKGGKSQGAEGKTASGKTIHDASHAAYKDVLSKKQGDDKRLLALHENHSDFSAQDHKDAQAHHEKTEAALKHASSQAFESALAAQKEGRTEEAAKGFKMSEKLTKESRKSGTAAAFHRAAARSGRIEEAKRNVEISGLRKQIAAHQTALDSLTKTKVTKTAREVIAEANKHAPEHPAIPLNEKVENFTQARKELVLKSVGGEKAIAGVDEFRQLVYAPVLIPDEISVKGHAITCEDIEYSAHYYLQSGALVKSEHGHLGNNDPIDAHVVESFIAPQDLHFDGANTPYGPQTIPKGSWIVGIKVNDPDEWAKVMSGEYTGFSSGGDSHVYDLELKDDEGL